MFDSGLFSDRPNVSQDFQCPSAKSLWLRRKQFASFVVFFHFIFHSIYCRICWSGYRRQGLQLQENVLCVSYRGTVTMSACLSELGHLFTHNYGYHSSSWQLDNLENGMKCLKVQLSISRTSIESGRQTFSHAFLSDVYFQDKSMKISMGEHNPHAYDRYRPIRHLLPHGSP